LFKFLSSLFSFFAMFLSEETSIFISFLDEFYSLSKILIFKSYSISENWSFIGYTNIGEILILSFSEIFFFFKCFKLRNSFEIIFKLLKEFDESRQFLSS
jgi:hypothetical protein